MPLSPLRTAQEPCSQGSHGKRGAVELHPIGEGTHRMRAFAQQIPVERQDKVIVEGLGRAVAGGGVALPQAVSDNMDNPGDDPPVINPGDATHLGRKQWPQTGELSLGKPEMVVSHDNLPCIWAD